MLAGSVFGASSATTWLPSSVRRKILTGPLGPVCHQLVPLCSIGTVLQSSGATGSGEVLLEPLEVLCFIQSSMQGGAATGPDGQDEDGTGS